MRDTRKKLVVVIVSILATSVLIRVARLHLVGIRYENLNAWPAQVIFGLYFTILTLAVQGLARLMRARSLDFHLQSLLLLALVGDCLDMVLVNVQETSQNPDASYGLVVIWDVTTFFVWLRVIDLCRPRNHRKFHESWPVMVAPLFALGREVLFLPYSWPGLKLPPGEPGLAYLDLAFGQVLISLWVFIPFVHGSRTSTRKLHGRTIESLLTICAFTGCVYWLVSAFVNTVAIAWAPSEPWLYSVFEQLGIPVQALNWVQFVIATSIVLLLRYLDILGLGTRFGIRTA